ncbi:hypothetical protein [Brachybacterium sp. p3-SID957]|uniref:hypothetical protein n=1 Tax=Brachybacterium sp. p3-SID957 TaxID=2916049 RepID=UPI00223C0385|nr:hypothetical protein [Brachybacterium sp. p3-SID957]MCT1775530.1 hypothetical protein [Brachybacterium sp. p3-SID957]
MDSHARGWNVLFLADDGDTQAEVLTLVEPQVYRGNIKSSTLWGSLSGGAEWLACQAFGNDGCADYLYDLSPDKPGLQLIEITADQARRPVVAVSAASGGIDPVAERNDSYGVDVDEAREVARMLDVYSMVIEPSISLVSGVPKMKPEVEAKRSDPEALKREPAHCALSSLKMTPERAAGLYRSLLQKQGSSSAVGDLEFWEDTHFLNRVGEIISDPTFLPGFLKSLTGCDLLAMGGDLLVDALPGALARALPGACQAITAVDFGFGAQAAASQLAMYDGWNTGSFYVDVLPPLMHHAVVADREARLEENRRVVEEYDWRHPTVTVSDRFGNHEALATLVADDGVSVEEIWRNGEEVVDTRVWSPAKDIEPQAEGSLDASFVGTTYAPLGDPLFWSDGTRAGAYLDVSRMDLPGEGGLHGNCIYSYVADQLTLRLAAYECSDTSNKWGDLGLDYRFAWRVTDDGQLEQWARERYLDEISEPWTEGEPYVGAQEADAAQGSPLSTSGEYWRFTSDLEVVEHDFGEGVIEQFAPVPWPANPGLERDIYEEDLLSLVDAMEARGQTVSELERMYMLEEGSLAGMSLEEAVRHVRPALDPYESHVYPSCLSGLPVRTEWSDNLCEHDY